jgi:hypothetical protein
MKFVAMTSSGLKLNFGNGFLVGAKNQRMGTDPGKQMKGTGRGKVKWPPYHDELTTAQHPNSKSRLGGSKSYAGGTPFRNSQRFGVAIFTFDATN